MAEYKFLSDSLRGIDQVRSAIYSYVSSKILDYRKSNANVFTLTIDVLTDLIRFNQKYQSNVLREQNPLTAQYDSSIIGLASLTSHMIVGSISARGTVMLRRKQAVANSVIKLTEDTVFRSDVTGELYVLANRMLDISTSANSIELSLIQGKRASQTIYVDTQDSTALYVIDLPNNVLIDHYSIEVRVNDFLFERVDSIFDMSSGTRAYMLRNNFSSRYSIVLGNASHGVAVKPGDVIKISYIETTAESGNVGLSTKMSYVSGAFDNSGGSIELNNYYDIVTYAGFQLGSSGDNMSNVKQLIGYSSRSLTFARPENLKAYLSRLSTLSYVRVYTLEDDLVFYILAIKKLTSLTVDQYLNTDTSMFLLSSAYKNELKLMIEASRRQYVGTEFVLLDPVLRTYAVFVYVESIELSNQKLKNDIEQSIVNIMLSKTFNATDVSSDSLTISKLEILTSLKSIEGLTNVSIDILSKQNEDAKLAFGYRNAQGVLIDVPDGADALLGLNELGDIVLERSEIPILSHANVRKYSATAPYSLSRGIEIFRKTSTGEWRKI